MRKYKHKKATLTSDSYFATPLHVIDNVRIIGCEAFTVYSVLKRMEPERLLNPDFKIIRNEDLAEYSGMSLATFMKCIQILKENNLVTINEKGMAIPI